MPDTGDFDRQNEPQGANFAWGDAFAALPQEAPDAGGWQRIEARLPAPTRSAVRWPLWLAMAASLVLAVAIPLRLLPQAEPPAAAAIAQVTAPPAVTQTVAPLPVAIEAPPVSIPAARRDAPQRDTRVAPSRQPIRTIAPPPGASRVANAGVPDTVDLEPLYAQSAQLESLLALARDERMANGTSAALSDGLDARLASIDAALVEPGLDATRRAELWGQRVDALQQLVGIETTQRLYAARGQSYQAALVSID